LNPYLELKEKVIEIERRLNYCFNDNDLLLLSFVHRSFINENKKVIENHNERLEFLGDAVLNLVITEHLFKTFPKATEGKLSFLRSQIVDSNSCELYLKKLALEEYVLLGKGEKQTENRGRSSILADLFEAIVGAVYIDGGFEKAKEFLLTSFEEEIKSFLEMPSRNYKAKLQTYCQRKYNEPPCYKIADERGPDHSKTFDIIACVEDIELGKGSGLSKKEAEQEAAKNALESL
jgi:ribonuclease-3